MPIFAPLHVVLVLLLYVLKQLDLHINGPLKQSGSKTTHFKRNIKSRTLTYITNFIEMMKDFNFEMNFIDFSFASTYALMGPYSLEPMLQPSFIISKAIALFLVFDCSLFLSRVAMTAIYSILPSTGQLSAKAVREAVVEGISHDKVSIASVRIYNLVYHLKLMLF